MKRKGLLIGLLIAALAIMSAACGGGNNNAGSGGAAEPAPATDGAAAGTTDGAGGAIDEAEATALYEANCMACHAADFSGGGAFPNLTAVGSRLSQEEIANTISNGGNGMPSFKGRLSDDEINTLAAWLATKK